MGGTFFRDIEEYVIKNSQGVVQNAADAFQTNLLNGMSEVCSRPVIVLNFPFVGSYPKRFKKLFFKDFFYKNFYSYGFLNFTGVKLISRFLVAFKALKSHSIIDDDTILVYSIHLPFLAAVAIYKSLCARDLTVVLIVPDLPEFMDSGTSRVKTYLKKIQEKLLRNCYKYVDGYVFLTKHMYEKIPVSNPKFVVVEGVSAKISDLASGANFSYPTNQAVKSVFYSGTLDERYGIKELITAVLLLPYDVNLLICGDGDSKEFVQDAASQSNRITYLGQLSRREVLNIQGTVSLLINPRTNTGEYTKYSFPSKVIEYMSSGRPVLMYKLSGIPEEYYNYCYTIPSEGIESLTHALDDVLSLPKADLDYMGLRAKEFVFSEKSGFHQASKILCLIKRLK